MISSDDARWAPMNKTIMNIKLKIMSINVIENVSDSGDEVEEGTYFLKEENLQLFGMLQ